MQITIGKKPKSMGGGWGVLPTYDFPGWSLTVDQADRLVYRPGLKTFSVRLLFSGFMIGAALLFYYGYNQQLRAAEQRALRTQDRAALEQDVFDHALAAGLDASEVERIQREHEARTSPLRQAPFGMSAGAQRNVQWGVAAFIAVMLLIPLSAAWNRILLVASPRRELVVKSWYLFPKTVRIPWSDIGGIQYGAEEMIHRSPRGGMITEHYWKWSVRLKSKSSEAPWFATFFPHKQPESPGAQARPPQQVARFIQWCLAHSRVSVSGPYLIEKTWERSGLRRGSKGVILSPTEQSGRHWGDWKDLSEGPVIHRKVTEKFVYEDENGVRRTFNSRDEIPPDIREKMQEALSRNPQVHVSQRIVIRDADGREHHYDSLEDVPPEMRRRIEELRRHEKGQA